MGVKNEQHLSCNGTNFQKYKFSYLASRVCYFIPHTITAKNKNKQKTSEQLVIQVGMSVHLITIFHIFHKCQGHTKQFGFKWQSLSHSNTQGLSFVCVCVAPLCVCWCFSFWWKGSDTELCCPTLWWILMTCRHSAGPHGFQQHGCMLAQSLSQHWKIKWK